MQNKSDQKVIKDQFRLKSTKTAGSWIAKWQAQPDARLFFDLTVYNQLNFEYQPKLNSIGYSSIRPLLAAQSNAGPWFWVSMEQDTASSRKYDLLEWESGNGRARFDTQQASIHRKFANLGFDPDRILDFIKAFGMLGHHGVFATTTSGKPVLAEPYENWCDEIFKMNLLCSWVDHLNGEVKFPEERLATWFKTNGTSGEVLNVDAFRYEIPDLMSGNLKHQLKEYGPTFDLLGAGTALREIPNKVAIEPMLKLRDTEPIPLETRRQLESLGSKPGEFFSMEMQHPNIFEATRLVIDERINDELQTHTSTAIQIFETGETRQLFYLVAKNLLGYLYKSLCDEIIGVRSHYVACSECSACFVPTRSDQRFCSANCRQVQAHRKSRARARISDNS